MSLDVDIFSILGLKSVLATISKIWAIFIHSSGHPVAKLLFLMCDPKLFSNKLDLL